jgi:hypothetical protein
MRPVLSLNASPRSGVALVRSIHAAWERGEFLIDPEWAHPEIECVMVDGPTPDSGSMDADVEVPAYLSLA